jgi:hypothetical protein
MISASSFVSGGFLTERLVITTEVSGAFLQPFQVNRLNVLKLDMTSTTSITVYNL